MTIVEGPCRVTVVGARRRVDVTVPGGVGVAELIPDLLRLVEVSPAAEDGTPAAWTLSRLDGRPLDPERSLAEAQVQDGDILRLQPEITAG